MDGRHKKPAGYCGADFSRTCEGCGCITVETVEGLPPLSRCSGHGICTAERAVLDFPLAFGSTTMHIHAIYGDRLTMWEDDYGKTWLAYRRRPEEVTT